MKPLLLLLSVLAAVLASEAGCASATPGETGTNSLALASTAPPITGEGHVKVCLLGGFAIGGDGPTTERACSRFAISKLPARFDIPRPEKLTDPEYAITATLYMGADEALSVGDYLHRCLALERC